MNTTGNQNTMKYLEPRKYLIEFWRKDADGGWHLVSRGLRDLIPDDDSHWPTPTRRYGGEMRVYEFASAHERSGFTK